MDSIIIRDLLLHGIIGVNPEERVTKQAILINIELFCDVAAAGATDDLTQSIDYGAVVNRVTERVEQGQDLLVEKLATDLAKIALFEFHATKVTVQVEKPTIIKTVKTVGVKITRSAADFDTLQ
jgi:dihydroneopterin aldolase